MKSHVRLLQRTQFPLKNHRIEHHTVADEVDQAGAENSRWDRVQYIFFSSEFERVPGIGSALKTRHDIVVVCQIIHNFTFTLVAPLQPQDYVDLMHIIDFK